jgi:hypothetical protein
MADKPEPVRVDLNGACAGRHILVDYDRLTVGVLEDLEGGRMRLIRSAVQALVVGGDLDVSEQAVRSWKLPVMSAVLDGIRAGMLPKVPS